MESLVKDLLDQFVGRLDKIGKQQKVQLQKLLQFDQVLERLEKIEKQQDLHLKKVLQVDQILARLENLETQQEAQLKKQSQTDQVIERLDTIQNCLERQNHKQNLLHDKVSAVSVSTQMVEEKVFLKDKLLSDLSTQLEQEKVFIQHELRKAQDNILHQLSELQQQEVSNRSQAVSADEEMTQLKAADGPNPVRETVEFCSQASGDVMNARLDKLSETLGAVIRAEVVWLDNQAQQRVSNSCNAMTGLVKDALNKAKNDVSSHVEAAKEEIIVDMNSASLRLKEEIIEVQKELSHSFQEHTDLSMKVTAENNSENLDRVKHELMENTKIVSLKLREDLLRSHKEAVQNTQGRTERTIKESLDKVHTNLDKTKRDLVALVEGQCQIVRDRIAGPLPRQRKYVCDFYIENFRQLIRSGKEVTSVPWHINQFDSSVRGYADFPLSGKMNICLMYGRNPHELGLQLRSGVMFKAKAVISCTSGQLPELEVGEVTSPWQEEGIKDNKYWGKFLGAVLCNELLEMGYGQKEGYLNGALLVRYEIEVL